MTCNAVHYAEEHGVEDRRGMKEFYQTLNKVELASCYKIASMTRACAVVKSRRKSEKRVVKVGHLRPLRQVACIISGFITMKGRLFIPLRTDRYFDVQLDRYTVEKLADKKVRSLTMTPDSLSFCYSEDIEPAPVRRVYGVDRNEENIAFGDRGRATLVDVKRIVKIRQTTREIIGSFKRDDVRIRRKLARKYWTRASRRTDQILHAATNYIVDSAAKDGAALAIEDLTGIKKMYRRGNGQGVDYRFRLNSWPHWKAKKMLEYKAAWSGVTLIQLTKSETYGSSSSCSACGERLRSPARGDAAHWRVLWCQTCKGPDGQGRERGPEPVHEGAVEVQPFPFFSVEDEGGGKSLAATYFLPQSDRKGGRAARRSDDGERDDYPNPPSRCQQVDATARAEELTEP